ncbi:hypothetical protein QEN19_003519 [Hanseniaspora menglaensis]
MFAVFMFTVLFNPFLQQYLPIFAAQRDLYEARERPSRTFSWKAFILAQMSAEFPCNFLAGAIGFLCFYYPVGIYKNASVDGQLSERSGLFFMYSVAYFIWIGSMSSMVAAPFDDPQAGGNLANLMFTMSIMFNGVFVGPKQMPGFWKFMYRVSPLTYFIDGTLSLAIANNKVTCSEKELKTIIPPKGLTCGEYMDPYFKSVGTGYLTDYNATDKVPKKADRVAENDKNSESKDEKENKN